MTNRNKLIVGFGYLTTGTATAALAAFSSALFASESIRFFVLMAIFLVFPVLLLSRNIKMLKKGISGKKATQSLRVQLTSLIAFWSIILFLSLAGNHKIIGLIIFGFGSNIAQMILSNNYPVKRIEWEKLNKKETTKMFLLIVGIILLTEKFVFSAFLLGFPIWIPASLIIPILYLVFGFLPGWFWKTVSLVLFGLHLLTQLLGLAAYVWGSIYGFYTAGVAVYLVIDVLIFWAILRSKPIKS